MEASETAVEIARKKYNLNVVKALTFDELPKEFKGSYKVITAFEVIEHVEKPLEFLQGIYNLLDDIGFFLLSCPNYFKFENLALTYRKYKWWQADFPPNHISRFKLWTLYYGLKLAGFEEVVIFTEPLLTGTVLEGLNPKEVEIKQKEGKNLILPRNFSIAIVLDALKPLYVNARYLGNFQCVIGVKGKSGINWEKVLRDAIAISATDIMWKDDKR